MTQSAEEQSTIQWIDSQVELYKEQREKSGGMFANNLGRSHLTPQEIFYYSDGVIDGLLIAKLSVQKANMERAKKLREASDGQRLDDIEATRNLYRVVWELIKDLEGESK